MKRRYWSRYKLIACFTYTSEKILVLEYRNSNGVGKCYDAVAKIYYFVQLLFFNIFVYIYNENT